MKNALLGVASVAFIGSCSVPESLSEPQSFEKFHKDRRPSLLRYASDKIQSDNENNRAFRMLDKNMVIDKSGVESEYGFFVNGFSINDSLMYIGFINMATIKGNSLTCKDGTLRCVGQYNNAPPEWQKRFRDAAAFAATQPPVKMTKTDSRAADNQYFQKDSLFYEKVSYAFGLKENRAYDFKNQKIMIGSECAETFDITISLMRANMALQNSYQKAQTEYDRRQQMKVVSLNKN